MPEFEIINKKIDATTIVPFKCLSANSIYNTAMSNSVLTSHNTILSSVSGSNLCDDLVKESQSIKIDDNIDSIDK